MQSLVVADAQDAIKLLLLLSAGTGGCKPRGVPRPEDRQFVVEHLVRQSAELRAVVVVPTMQHESAPFGPREVGWEW